MFQTDTRNLIFLNKEKRAHRAVTALGIPEAAFRPRDRPKRQRIHFYRCGDDLLHFLKLLQPFLLHFGTEFDRIFPGPPFAKHLATDPFWGFYMLNGPIFHP